MSHPRRRIYSNAPGGNFVINPFKALTESASKVCAASAYFSYDEPVCRAAAAGTEVLLLIGLNAASNPEAVRAVHKVPNIDVRYYTERFHAKFYLFDDAALVGSANLTHNGMIANREGVICLDREHDAEAIAELKALFAELWEGADVLTGDIVATFAAAHARAKAAQAQADSTMREVLSKVEPPNIAVESRNRSPTRIFLQGLRREVQEGYGKAFREVLATMSEHALHRQELVDALGIEHETGRFLSFVRQTHAVGERSWQSAPLRDREGRANEVRRLGREWVETKDTMIVPHFIEWLRTVEQVFGTQEALHAASQERLSEGLMCIHAFYAQQRFVRGGAANLAEDFWAVNDGEVEHVKATLMHLLYGEGDFALRLHDTLYDNRWKLNGFGRFCALELYGSVHPSEFPPVNGRIAKALRFIGYDVSGA